MNALMHGLKQNMSVALLRHSFKSTLKGLPPGQAGAKELADITTYSTVVVVALTVMPMRHP